MEEYYLICEDSLEGIFSGVYQAYLQKCPLERVHLIAGEEENYRLFAVYRRCGSSREHAEKVGRTLKRELGEEGYYRICRTLASYEADKAEAVFRTIVMALHRKTGGKILEDLKDPYIRRVFELDRTVGNETHSHIEFIRFRELADGVLYAQISPKNHILTFLMPHFTDRFPLENFVIHDIGRNLFAVHPAEREYVMVSGQEEWKLPDTFSEGEEKYSELFTEFFHTIAIKERTNSELQRGMLPVRYRKYMTEFNRENTGNTVNK